MADIPEVPVRPAHTPSEPFTRASLYSEGSEASASAEYGLGDVRLRLVWEGEERVLFIECARAAGASLISRWVDIEWAVAGERLEVDRDLTDARLEKLATALVAFLDRGRAAAE